MADWRIILGDLTGRPIANLSRLAKDRSITVRMMKPDSFSFRVPSWKSEVGGTHSDGLPKLEALRRTLRMYRRETLDDGSEMFVCRHAGVVWTLQDSGDANGNAWTQVVSYAPMQRLAYRFTGQDATPRVGDGAQLAKALVDQANAVAATGISTAAADGAIFDAAPSQSVTFERLAVGDGVVQLAKAYNSFEFAFDPIDEPVVFDGKLVVMSCRSRLGEDRPGVVFGWGTAPHNVSSLERNVDPSSVANYVIGLGNSASGADSIVASASNPDSIAAVGRYETVDSESDVTDAATLQGLVNAKALSLALPSVTLNMQVASSSSRVPRPWQDFGLGDTVRIRAGQNLRGGLAEAQRVYSFTVNNSDNGVESLSNVATSPDEVA